ncbi:30S ribosomal protein S7 [Candidatus Hodgkinia cicadicola]|uniref:30S ribosomal protein S7 n=1 Tax=Candidatus Hodgkinia cicadicola TaxID=573658 RepID=A0ABX4MGK6_9HYPH|nr:30S ribosomal protein S7 [Candidatus Hodgkinia cicadicola]PIM95962.1 30S ribosomal protein S7 [Candidatus Hodgkinia cicadicola]PIM96191.1 30S ribosomal protein S7 [Candidatus Hodgkinia cicadicola]
MSRNRKVNNTVFSYSDKCLMLSKLINYIMRDGKKRMAMLILKKSLDYINDRLHINPLKVLYEAVDNVTPYIEVRNMRIGGVSYQIPIDIPVDRRLGLGLRWMVDAAKQRREVTAWLRLAWEIIDSVLRKSSSFKRRETMHNLAKNNQAFAHMGW